MTRVFVTTLSATWEPGRSDTVASPVRKEIQGQKEMMVNRSKITSGTSYLLHQ
jgi:hypothetical protein